MFVAAGPWGKIRSVLPTKALTVSAWVSVDSMHANGGIVSAFQDNGDAETGWVIGYNEKTFTFGLASDGANDGDGKMTYLGGKTQSKKANGIMFVVFTTERRCNFG